MTYLRNFLLASLICVASGAVAADIDSNSPDAGEQEPIGYRSKVTDPFWVFGDLDFALSPGSDFSAGGGAGGMSQIGVRYMPWRWCGFIAQWRVTDLDYYDPGHVHASMFGAGASCRIVTFGKKRKFWRGANLEARGLVETGKVTYHIYTNDRLSEKGAGSATGTGLSSSIVFNFPLFFGIWGTANFGFDTVSWDYATSAPAAKGNTSVFDTVFGVGVSYSFDVE